MGISRIDGCCFDLFGAEEVGKKVKLSLIPLVIINAIWNVFIVLFVLMLLIIGYSLHMAAEKIMTFWEWVKVLGFRCITYSGMCLINLVCAIGFTAPEMIEWRDKLKEANKKKEEA